MPEARPPKSQSTQWLEEGLCPVCGGDPLGGGHCPHLAAVYDSTFPSPNGTSLCPLELGGVDGHPQSLDDLTRHLLGVLLLVKQMTAPRRNVEEHIRRLPNPLDDLLKQAMKDKCARNVGWEEDRFTFDSDALLRPFARYVNAVFEATPGYIGSGNGDAGGPGFTSGYEFQWAENGPASAAAATEAFGADALRVGALLRSIEGLGSTKAG